MYCHQRFRAVLGFFFVGVFVEKIKDVSLSNYTAKTFEKSMAIKIDVDERFMKMKSCMRHKRERLSIASRVKTIELRLIEFEGISNHTYSYSLKS